ncbi:MAG: hypothetical protein Q9220_004194 [cf. Caloplaca sp. 1 TL-2023]
MNSLNLLSSRVTGQSVPSERPANYRRRSFSEGNVSKNDEIARPRRSASQHVKRESSTETLGEKDSPGSEEDTEKHPRTVSPPAGPQTREGSPAIRDTASESGPNPKHYKLYLAARRLVKVLVESIQLVLSTLIAPGTYAAKSLYDEHGAFSPLRPAYRLGRVIQGRGGSKSTAQAVGLSASPVRTDRAALSKKPNGGSRRSTGARSKVQGSQTPASKPPAIPESKSQLGRGQQQDNRSREDMGNLQMSSSSDESTPMRRSIRIRLYNEDSARKRKVKQTEDSAMASGTSFTSNKQEPRLTIATIKSPTSPASSLRMTKYPRAPAPPRPLIPFRQPSYSAGSSARPLSTRIAQKTLVIDLDETLIHSLAKGGRMSSGHMVEVRLNTIVGYGGATLGPQHPILYYVHKRPHCDEFLRKVCKWYELVVFTASVQEYADPVIDWLEQERQYFTRRYYRQHCTFRNGAYIKDLSSVEPDLSKIMIIDNSPLSYIFHEDNAIPIEGWINDPTDNDLLHLIPLLEALQYVMDVRALLALRRGEIEAPR